jgi:hypothetical protein
MHRSAMGPIRIRPLSTSFHRSLCGLLSLMGLLVAGPAVAAPISWNPAQSIVGATDIVLAGALVEAINGTGTGTSPTVNGVSFLASDALLSQSFGGDALAGGSSGDAGLDGLLRQFDYGNGTTTTISVGGGLLVSGADYLIQVFYTDLRGCCSGRTMTFGDGLGGNVAVHASGGGLGQYAVGTFQADGTSQNLSMATAGFGNAHINAYQIRAIPEPDAMLLVMLGLVSLTRRSRHPRDCRTVGSRCHHTGSVPRPR